MKDDEGTSWVREALSRHQASLVRFAYSITGNLDQARDVVQDTFLRLCRQNPSRVRDHLVEWLFTVCRNRALDVRRKESRMTSLSDAGASSLPTPGADPAVLAEVQDTSRRVLLLLEQLPEKHREVVLLKFQNDLSYKEISRITQLSVSNVGFILHNSLKKIRKQLEEQHNPRTAEIRRIK